MISVRNHLRLLSGNNSIFFLIVLTVFLSSCGASKKSVGKPAPKPVVKKDQPLPGKIDTVVWKEVPAKPKKTEVNPDEKTKDTGKKEDKTSRPLTEIKLLALIPFKTDDIDTSGKNIQPGNLRFVHYYAGMKMALEEFNNSNGIPIHLEVFDTGENDRSKEILSSYKGSLPQVIIGPYKSEGLKFSAEWAKKNETYLISPWISSSTITDENPYYFQVKAGLNAHYQLINEHVRNHFPVDNVVMISKSKEDSKLKFFNTNEYDSLQIKEEIISEEDLAVRTEPLLERYFKSEGPTVFILPMASSRDENYIYHFLRRVMSEKKGKPVIIYGLYKWLEMKSEVLDYINVLNVRISISNFVDNDNSAVRSFKRKYFDIYREFPSEAAMEGYDLTKYLILAMRKKGFTFYEWNEERKNEYLETQFDFKPIYKDDGKNQKEIDYYENKYIRIIEVKENKYRIID
jgi:hypothetical protein